MMMKNLILASGSPRRKELLSLYTTDFTICVSDFDESGVTAPTPAQLVEKLARGKCLAVAKDHPGAVVLGCDTVVDVGGEVFGKPHSVEDAKRMLRALSGATHEVHTGVCVSDGVRTESFVDSCKVTFFPISEGEIDAYTATKEPYDKAGAYWDTRDRTALRKAGRYFAVILIFALGAGFGGVASQLWGTGAIWASCLLLAVSFLLMFRQEIQAEADC